MVAELKKIIKRRETVILGMAFLLYFALIIATTVKPEYSEWEVWSKTNYDNNVEQLRVQVEMMGDQAQNAPTKYDRLDNQKAYDCYNVKHTFEPYNAIGTAGIFWYLEQPRVRYAYVGFLVFFLCSLFAGERESGMYQVLFTSKCGKRRLFWDKFFFAALGVACISFLFSVVMFAGMGIRRNLELKALVAPIQSMEDYFYCPFQISILEYVLILWGFLFLAGMVAAGILFVLSALGAKRLMILVGTLLVAMLGEGMLLLSPGSGVSLRKLGLVHLLRFSEYFTRYETVNVFGIPVFRLTIALVFTILVSAFLFTLAYLRFTANCRGRGGEKHVA